MGLKKGQCNNLNGRPVGAKNKSGQEVKELINDLFNENTQQIRNDLAELHPIERLKFFVALLPYVLQKQTPEDEKQRENTPPEIPSWMREPIEITRTIIN